MRFTATSNCACSTPTKPALGLDPRDEYGFQPIVVFDGEGRFITAVLRPAKRPGGREIKGFLRRLLRAIRANWPRTEILLRGDSHYCAPEVLDFCRANGLDYMLGVAPTVTLRRHVERLEAATKTRYEAAAKDGKVRRFKEFYDGAASWSRVERIIARVEVGAEGPDTRFVVTNLKQRNARRLYEEMYCRRGTGRKPHQVVEDPPRGRPNLVHESLCQPTTIVSARGRLLDNVGPARVDAEAFDVASGAVRHVAAAPDQGRRARRRNEDDDPRASADIVSRTECLALRARANPASRNPALRHLTGGA
jgi:hypothetical protein